MYIYIYINMCVYMCVCPYDSPIIYMYQNTWKNFKLTYCAEKDLEYASDKYRQLIKCFAIHE